MQVSVDEVANLSLGCSLAEGRLTPTAVVVVEKVGCNFKRTLQLLPQISIVIFVVTFVVLISKLNEILSNVFLYVTHF